MIDREKVRKGIAFCLSRFHCGENCPYYNAGKTECMESLQKDTLDLLKEQEPVKPTHLYYTYHCGMCGYLVGIDVIGNADGCKNQYCPNCGRKIDWKRTYEKKVERDE